MFRSKSDALESRGCLESLSVDVERIYIVDLGEIDVFARVEIVR